MMQGKVLCFGELLLRICPDIMADWISDHQLPFYVGGAELNVAAALAQWNIPTVYLSALPQNAISEDINSYLQKKQIDTDSMIWKGERIGLYYLPKGKDLKNAGVIYDRAHSSFAGLSMGDINWDTVFKDVSWFHFSAICPALSQELADLCLEAAKIAQKKGIFVSLDLNYRSKLWKYGLAPKEVMPSIAEQCNLIMGNIWAAHHMLGISIQPTFLHKNSGYSDRSLMTQAEETSREIGERFPNCQIVANTFRFDYQQRGIRYYTTLFNQNILYRSDEYISANIVDKVGSGDCFMAGLIYGFYNQLTSEETLAFATAAAYDKLFIEGDATSSTVEHILEQIKK